MSNITHCLVFVMQWLNNCVGRKNYITFVCLMAVSLLWVRFNYPDACLNILLHFSLIRLHFTYYYSFLLTRVVLWCLLAHAFVCLCSAHFWVWSWHCCPCSMLCWEKSYRTPDFWEAWRWIYSSSICYCSGTLSSFFLYGTFFPLSFHVPGNLSVYSVSLFLSLSPTSD